MKIVYTEEFCKEICKKNQIKKKFKTYKKTLQELHKESCLNISFGNYIYEMSGYNVSVKKL